MKSRQASASVSLPTPVEPRLAMVLEALAGGAGGRLSGCDLWTCLPSLRARNLGMAQQRPMCGYDDWILFLKEENGDITIVQIYSAAQYKAEMVRKIVGYCTTEYKGYPFDMHNRLPTVEQLAERLKTAQ